MRRLRRATFATIAAGSLIFLGFGVAHAVDISEVTPVFKITRAKTTEGCSNQVTVKDNTTQKSSRETEGDGFSCSQELDLD